MSIVLASRLSRADLGRLSNNIGRPKRHCPRSATTSYRRVVAAVNRSLAHVGERVDRLSPAGVAGAY